jgi:hypothetical protein
LYKNKKRGRLPSFHKNIKIIYIDLNGRYGLLNHPAKDVNKPYRK